MTITQLHYTAWPDHGVPDNVMSLIAFIHHVRKVHPVSHEQSLLVHCSAGVGRTGTLIVLDIVMQQMKVEGSLSVHQCLRRLRMQRMKMVQGEVSIIFMPLKKYYAKLLCSFGNYFSSLHFCKKELLFIYIHILQQQYEFIHCGLSELVVCGETEIAAANLRITINNLKKMTDEGVTGFQKQLQVYKTVYTYKDCLLNSSFTHQIIDEMSSHQPVSYADAKQEYNNVKNRFPDKLPSECVHM